MKIDILTEEEYIKIKDPTYIIRKFLEKKKGEKMKKLQAEINRLENIINLSYDKNGEPIFTGMHQRKYPIYQDTDDTVIYEKEE